MASRVNNRNKFILTVRFIHYCFLQEQSLRELHKINFYIT